MERPESIASCVDAFADSVVKYGEFIFNDPKVANRHYDRSVQALKQLSRFGDDGMAALAALLDDEVLEVRVTAACHVIHYRRDKALQVLKAAAKARGRAISMLAIAAL